MNLALFLDMNFAFALSVFMNFAAVILWIYLKFTSLQLCEISEALGIVHPVFIKVARFF